MSTFNLHHLRFGNTGDSSGEVIVFTELTGFVIGTANCVITGKRIMLDYITVQEHMRRKKVGTLLLQETLDFARSKGLEEIWGSLMPIHDTPWLKAWFTKHGFELHPPTPENTQGSALGIRRRL